MGPAELRADCRRCVGLCCVALAFDRSALFAIDKPSGVACPHLTTTDRCDIHETLTLRGFGGCVRYDCAGAGQRVTVELFGGRSWRTEPALREPMQRAFLRLRDLHELLGLLHGAAALALSPEQSAIRQRLVDTLDPPRGWTVQTLEAFDVAAAAGEVSGFLRGLQGVISRARAKRLNVVG